MNLSSLARNMTAEFWNKNGALTLSKFLESELEKLDRTDIYFWTSASMLRISKQKIGKVRIERSSEKFIFRKINERILWIVNLNNSLMPHETSQWAGIDLQAAVKEETYDENANISNSC